MDEGSSGSVTVPKVPLLVSFSLALGPNSPPLLERPECEDGELGLEVKRSDFEGGPADTPLASGAARRAFAFGLKMSPKGPGVDPPVNVGPVEFGSGGTAFNSGACEVGFELVVFDVGSGAAENEKVG